MIVKLNPKTKSEDIERLIKEVEDLGVSASLIEGFEKSVIGLVGDTTLIDEKKLEGNKIVEKRDRDGDGDRMMREARGRIIFEFVGNS